MSDMEPDMTTTTPLTTTLPLEPVTNRLPGHVPAKSDEHAKQLGVTVRVWRQIQKAGAVPIDLADRIAHGVREHPGVLWPAGWREAAALTLDDEDPGQD